MCCCSDGARIAASVASEVSCDHGLRGSLRARNRATAGSRSSLLTARRITGSTAVRNVAHALAAAESGAQAQAAARREIAAFDREGCCYSFRDWHDDVNAVAVPFRDPRDGRWLVLSCSGPASSMGEDVFRERIGPRLRVLARRLGQAR